MDMTQPPPAATVPAPLFDFDGFEDVDRADVRIKDPTTGAPTGMVVTLAGPEHPERKRIEHARQRRIRAIFSKTQKLPMNDPEDDEAEAVELLVACTLGWSGAVVAFSRDAARTLYNDPRRHWLRAQLQDNLNERELFTRPSAGR